MEDTIVSFMRESLLVVCTVSAPSLFTALVIGFGISFFQAVTQIQEQTLAYIPKIICVFLILAISMSWMMNMIVRFAVKVFSGINLFCNWNSWI